MAAAARETSDYQHHEDHYSGVLRSDTANDEGVQVVCSEKDIYVAAVIPWLGKCVCVWL